MEVHRSNDVLVATPFSRGGLESSYLAFERFSFDQTDLEDLEERPRVDLEFSKRLLILEKKGIEIQYQLACLSTLGGAYHLCNHPETAFVIAMKQEMVGRLLGSHSIVIRSKVFQAVNLSLLGYPEASRMLFKACKRVAAANVWAGMEAFVHASEMWLKGQQAIGGGHVTGYLDTESENSHNHSNDECAKSGNVGESSRAAEAVPLSPID